MLRRIEGRRLKIFEMGLVRYRGYGYICVRFREDLPVGDVLADVRFGSSVG